MGLTESERKEFEMLELKFGNIGSFSIQSDSVFKCTHHPELVEDDEKNSYSGQFREDTPGMRFNYLGTLAELERYEALRRRDKM